MACRRVPERAERGFILVAAIWLLMLAGGIAAILMLRSLGAATETADRAGALRTRLGTESAVETVIADRQFNGLRSNWWTLPASGSVSVGDSSMSVRISSDSGRLDLNEASPSLIERALLGLGIPREQRTAFVDRLLVLRARQQRISSFAELQQLAAGLGGEGTCLIDMLTFASALPEPRDTQIPPALARALGRPMTANGDAADPGAALRFEVSATDGAVSTLLVRSMASSGNVEILDYFPGRLCTQ